MTKPAQRRNILIILLVILALLIGMIVLNKPKPTPYAQPQVNANQMKTYKATHMLFSIQVKQFFQIQDNDSSVNLVSSGGQISIIRNGTNFNDLDAYILNFDSKRKLISSDSKKISIDEYTALTRMVKFPEENMSQKSYYIYINHYVYILSTSSASLYNDLDQIAKSFRYTP